MFELVISKLDGVDKRLDSIDERLDGVDKRLDGIDERLDSVEARLNGIDKTLEVMDGRLIELEKNQNTILNFVSNADTEFAKIEEKAKDIDKLKKVINISAIR